MKTCPKCGTELLDNELFCAYCGHRMGAKKAAPRLDRPMTEREKQQPREKPLQSGYSPPKESSRSLFLGAAAVLLAFISPPLAFVLAVIGLVDSNRQLTKGQEGQRINRAFNLFAMGLSVAATLLMLLLSL